MKRPTTMAEAQLQLQDHERWPHDGTIHRFFAHLVNEPQPQLQPQTSKPKVMTMTLDHEDENDNYELTDDDVRRADANLGSTMLSLYDICSTLQRSRDVRAATDLIRAAVDDHDAVALVAHLALTVAHLTDNDDALAAALDLADVMPDDVSALESL